MPEKSRVGKGEEKIVAAVVYLVLYSLRETLGKEEQKIVRKVTAEKR